MIIGVQSTQRNIFIWVFPYRWEIKVHCGINAMHSKLNNYKNSLTVVLVVTPVIGSGRWFYAILYVGEKSENSSCTLCFLTDIRLIGGGGREWEQESKEKKKGKVKEKKRIVCVCMYDVLLLNRHNNGVINFCVKTHLWSSGFHFNCRRRLP